MPKDEVQRVRAYCRAWARQALQKAMQRARIAPTPRFFTFDARPEAARARQAQANALRRWAASAERAATPDLPPVSVPDRDTPSQVHRRVETRSGKRVTIGPTVVTDPAVDTDATLGAALSDMAVRAKGKGKEGWLRFIRAMTNKPTKLSANAVYTNEGELVSHGTSKAVKRLKEAWPEWISGATAFRHVRRLHERRLKMPKW
jgi:hypothetical protein